MRLLLIAFIFIFSFAREKTPSDVYSYAMLLKEKVIYLRKKAGIKKPFPYVPPQHHKYPRHVIQKALEILNKIDTYRILNHYGPIFIPPYPARQITPSDVYQMVKRVNAEVDPFIHNIKFLNSLKLVKYTGKTPNDVYRLLWSISLSFDDLLGIHGYKLTDIYSLSEKLLQIVKFLRVSQNIYTPIPYPQIEENLHINHALYKSYDFLRRVKKAENNLWINPTDVPKKPHKVITNAEVYDSIQYNIAELQRIKYRLGIERYFKSKKVKENKTVNDIVQAIEYAKELMPLFNLNKPVIQYPPSSLQKTPNHVFAVTQEIIKKINILRNLKGIHTEIKNPPYIYDLKPIHAYEKSIEATEKAIKLKVEMGYYYSQIPSNPLKPITPDEVYESVIRLDGIITILLNKLGYKTEEYIYKVDKTIPKGKKPSDVYHNLWIISNMLDSLLTKGYTPDENFKLIKNMETKIIVLLKNLRIKSSKIDAVLREKIRIENKLPKDIFNETILLFNDLKKVQKRMNMKETNIIIPIQNKISTNSVYNALRITNATLNEILIHKQIDDSQIPMKIYVVKNKNFNDIYIEILKIRRLLNLLYEESNYEN